MDKHARLVDVVLTTLTICAVITTTLVVRREIRSRHVSATSSNITADWAEYSRYGHRSGAANAPVAIVVFSDFQCPYCKLIMDRLDTVRAHHPGKIMLVYRHFPLLIHPYSIDAARASECAAAQGSFESMERALFASQPEIGHSPWVKFASTAGITDMGAFRNCVSNDSTLTVVERDRAAATRLGVDGTPVLLVNQFRLQGAQPIDTLEEYVARVLERSR